MKITKLFFWITLLILSHSAPVFAEASLKPIHTIILIRHAERAEKDDLSPQGKARAIYFAEMFKDAPVDKIYSTDYVRTRLSATPLAQEKNIGITLYDSNEHLLDYLNSDLKSNEPQTIVIVGHSNTLAEIIYSLGGPSLPDLGEHEFDHLYIVTKSMHRTGFVHLHYSVTKE